MRRPPSVVDELVQSVTRDILLGHILPSHNLPPIRALAEQHGVTVPTAQRAVARLAELGLIQVRHGSGMKVLDPRRSANLAALPYWLEALRGEPVEARRVLMDFLDLRAVLAVELLTRVGPKLSGDEDAPVHDAVETLMTLAQSNAPLDELVRADLEVARRLLELSPQVAFSALWSSLAALLEAVPEVARAMYREPLSNVMGWKAAFELAIGGEDLRTTLLPLIRQFDQLTASRFVEELER